MKRYKTSTGSGSDLLTSKKNIDFTEFYLANGLKCILYKDKSNPIVNLTLGYKVGSRDEEKNKKGIAHLFEHLMFQGSKNIKKNEHFANVMKSGGVCNAFTMQDATVYFEMMPSCNLETALWLESDRMNSLDITEENLSNQKSVVIEEKKQVYDNAPYGSTFQNIFGNIFHGSNYESTIIGEADDINSFTVNESKDFHENFYSPDNSVLIVLGDIEYGETEKLINKYFSGINKENKKERKKNIISPLKDDIELTVHDNIQLPFLNICYQIPKAGENDNYALEYFAEIIANNNSSRLYKELVYEKKLLKSIRAFKYPLEDGGVFILRAMINPGVNVCDIRNEIFLTIKELSETGCTDEEFRKVKNQIEFDNTIKYLKLQNISIETVFNYLYFKDTARINNEINKYRSVSKHDVINSVNDFIKDKKKFILTYLPKN